MKRRRASSAPACLACPHCRKSRHWHTLRGLNVHISLEHRGLPHVTPKAVLILILASPSKRSVLDLILPDA
ncbi:MAG: hypothetical protein JRN07_05685 [Nitrososphaerota archaeon]|nr:hypothetical protein [Nitrososphaerota archaeon]